MVVDAPNFNKLSTDKIFILGSGVGTNLWRLVFKTPALATIPNNGFSVSWANPDNEQQLKLWGSNFDERILKTPNLTEKTRYSKILPSPKGGMKRNYAKGVICFCHGHGRFGRAESVAANRPQYIAGPGSVVVGHPDGVIFIR